MVTDGNTREQEQTGQGPLSGQPSDAVGTSRRAFVLGGATIGIASIVGGRRTARLSVRERRIETAAKSSPILQVGSKAAVGATVSAGNPGGSTRLQAAQIFDQNMGGDKMALAVERVYWGPNEWQTGPNNSQIVQTLNQAGIAIVGSFTPTYPTSRTEKGILINSLSQLNSQGAIVDAICLMHEPNNGKLAASEYQQYIGYYGDAVINAGYPLAYIPLVQSTQANEVEAYYPTATYNGQPMVSRMYGDFYCNQYVSTVNPVTLEGFFNVAANHSTPRVGLGEFGKTTNSMNEPSDPQFDNYCQYLISEFQAWNKAGNNSGAIIYFTNGSANNPDSENYTSLEALWDALSIDA